MSPTTSWLRHMLRILMAWGLVCPQLATPTYADEADSAPAPHPEADGLPLSLSDLRGTTIEAVVAEVLIVSRVHL